MSATPLVLVTGAAGFLGSEVMRVLHARGARVIGIGHGPAPALDGLQRASFWPGDITCETLIAHGGEPDIIVHCAGGSSVSGSLADPQADFKKTVIGCEEVLSYLRTRRPDARLVLSSSAAVYGTGHTAPIDEQTPLNPMSPYGFHKQMCEQMVSFHARTWGLKAAIVRLFSVYGAGLKRQLLWDACRKFAAGTPLFSGTGEEVRDWVHVSDAATLLCDAALHASTDVAICNGATGHGASVGEILRQLAAALGVQDGTARFDGIARPGDPAYLVGTADRAQGWNWRPQVQAREGIRQYAHWFRAVTGEGDAQRAATSR